MIAKCSCSHPEQDKVNGSGMRVFNPTMKGSARCTVCTNMIGDTGKKKK